MTASRFQSRLLTHRFRVGGWEGLLIACALFSALSACGDGDAADTFDRGGMLTELGENVFLPTYRDAASTSMALHEAAESYCAAPSDSGLSALHTAFRAAHHRFKAAESFAIGPHTDSPPRLGPIIDDWPVEEADVRELLVSDEPVDLDSFSRRGNRVQGFAVVEYLLFGPDEELGAFADTPRRCAYLIGATDRLHALVDELRVAWEPTGGDHAGELASGSGRYQNSLHAAASILVEQMVFTIENVRELKVGKPFGKRDGGTLQPEQFEAPYGRNSRVAAEEAIRSVEAVYLGRYVDASGVTHDGVGVQDWLIARRPDLDGTIVAAFDRALVQLRAVTPDLESAIEADPDAVEQAYQAIKDLQLSLVMDLAAAVGVTVTFNPTDGD